MSSSANTNVVIVTGNLVRDAELRDAGSAKVLTFSIAVNEKYKSGDQWVDYANFFNVSLFGKRGEALAQYLTKGTRVAVEGKLHQDRWEKDGKKNSSIVIRAENLELIGGRSGGSQSAPAENSQPAPAAQNGDFQEDIPW